MKNDLLADRTEDINKMYGLVIEEGSEIIKGIKLINDLGDLKGYTNIGYADSYFEYWLLDPGISSKRLTAALIARTSKKKIKNILVVGCGRGGELILLNQLTGANITGIDISDDNLEYAKNLIKENEKEDHIKVFKAYAEELPFPSESFSCVYSCEAAFHFNDKLSFINEAYRVLKKQGSFIVGDITTKKELSELQHNILQDYKNMLCANTFFTKEDYIHAVKEIFGKQPRIMDITDKNIKHLARGSSHLLKIFDIIGKLPAFENLIKTHMKTKGMSIDVFLDNINITRLSYEHSVVEYIMIDCVK